MTSGKVKKARAPIKALWLAGGFALLLAPTHAAVAQLAPEHAVPESAEAASAEEADAEMEEIDVNKLDWSQLNVDASTLSYGTAPRTQGAAKSAEMTWSTGTIRRVPQSR